MKIKTVVANNRKRVFLVTTTTTRRVFEFPYSQLDIKPSVDDPISELFPDPELGFDGFTIRLASGKEDSVLIDQILDYVKDPEYVRNRLLWQMTLHAERRMKALGVSRREVIRRMGTTPTQFYRLMDRNNAGKTLDQMIRLLSALDCSVNLIFKDAA